MKIYVVCVEREREKERERFGQFEIIRNLKSKKEKGFWAWANDITNCIDCPKLLLKDY